MLNSAKLTFAICYFDVFVRYARTMMSSLIADNDLNEDNPETLIATGILKGKGLAIDEVCPIRHSTAF